MSDDNTTDDDSSYHPEDDVGSIPSMYELETESIAPIEAAPHDPEPIGLQVVNDNLQIEGVDYDNETIVTELEVTHTDDGDLFVPVELPENPVNTPCLSRAMKNLEIDGVTSPLRPPPPPTPPPPPPNGSRYPEWEGLTYSGKAACRTG